MSNKNYEHYTASARWRERARLTKWRRGRRCELCQNKILEAIARSEHPVALDHYEPIKHVRRFFDHYQEMRLNNVDPFVVHHKTYARIGREMETDLAVLCFACHVLIHDSIPPATLDQAWVLAKVKVAVTLRQIRRANSLIANALKRQRQMERTLNDLETTNTSFSWLLPPRDE
jgi:hypothetical protein